MKLLKLIGIGILSAAGILIFLSVVGYSPMPSDAPNAPKKIAIAPEMIVKPVHGGFLAACFSKDQLTELVGHSVRHEKTKFEAMFSRMDCVAIPETETYKILSVSNNMAEFVNVNARFITSEGMWAVVEAFSPAQ